MALALIIAAVGIAFLCHKTAAPEIQQEARAAVARVARPLTLPVALVWAWLIFELARSAG